MARGGVAGVAAGDLVRLATFAPGFWRYLRDRLSLDEARAELRRRLETREGRFLRLLKDGVYANADSPYRRLLEWADCDYGDVERAVHDRGLEAALGELHKAGVYVTFDEFKGRVPIVRHGRSLEASPEQFDNPLLSRPFFYGKSGGTTGAAVRVPLTWEYQRDMAVNYMLFEHAQGLLGKRFAYWSPGPDMIPFRQSILFGRFGAAADKWFGPPRTDPPVWALSRRAFIGYFTVVGRLAGLPLPWPQPVGLDEAEQIARWAARTRDHFGAAVVHGFVSHMLRVALAAQDAGLDMSGVTFVGGSEPPTPAKVGVMTSTGARWAPNYSCRETGVIGFGCAQPVDGNDLHFQKDRLALIQQPQQVPGSDLTVDAFCFTTLMESASKILLNTETDDYGVVERRSCGCPLEEYGLHEHLREVRSYRKLTGEGFTLVGTDMERILDETLPARFGGSPLDYQLVEEEDDQGFTRLNLVVHPRVHIEDEQAVVAEVLDALRQVDATGIPTAVAWEQAQTLRVRRQEPIRTGTGKLLPLHVGAVGAERTPSTSEGSAS